jgi:hypothetical protein
MHTYKHACIQSQMDETIFFRRTYAYIPGNIHTCKQILVFSMKMVCRCVICVDQRSDAQAQAQAHAHAHAHAQAAVHTCLLSEDETKDYVRSYAYVHVYVCIQCITYVYVYIYVYIYTCIHAYDI